MTKNIKAVALIADKKELRKPMTCVNFTGKQAVATDGFIMAITDCETEIAEKRYCEPYQKMKKNDMFLANLISTDNTVIEPKIIDCEYPDYEKVIPAEGANEHLKIGLSVSILKKLVKSMEATGTQIFEMQFSDDPLKAIVAYSNQREVKYIIMPAKIAE